MMYKKEHNDYRRELSFLAFTQIGIFPKQEAKTSFFFFLALLTCSAKYYKPEDKLHRNLTNPPCNP